MKASRNFNLLLLDTLRPLYAVAVVFLIMKFFINLPWPTKSGDALLGAALSVSSVVMGFLISAKAIIVSSPGKVMEQIKKTGLIVELVDNFRTTVYVSMAFSVFCTAGFFIEPGRNFVSIWVATGIAMLYCFLRICNILFRIVSRQ